MKVQTGCLLVAIELLAVAPCGSRKEPFRPTKTAPPKQAASGSLDRDLGTVSQPTQCQKRGAINLP